MSAAEPDPVTILTRLSADQLRQRLDKLDAERKAVNVLWQSARARERAQRRAAGTPPTQGADHAR
jgi:hypothetical protein